MINPPSQIILKNQMATPDSAYYTTYGARMVEAAEAGIESQRRWTLHHMGCEEVVDPYMGKEWVRKDDAIPVPEAVFGLRARMFARLQEGVSHMAELKPKDECPVPEDEMRYIAHALGHEFIVTNLKSNDRGYYVDACLADGKPVARAGVVKDLFDAHRKQYAHWLDEDYRAHLGYKAVLLAAARDLGEAPADESQKPRIWVGGA